MKYDFVSILDRRGRDAIAVDGLKGDGFSPAPPKAGFDAIPMWVADMNFPTVPTIQALNLRQLRKAMSVLRSAELIEVEASDNSLPVAMDASLKLGSLGKRCMTSAVPGRTRAFAATLTERDALLLISNSGRSERLLETARAAHERGASVLLITCDRRSPLAAQADHLLLASNRAQRIVATDPVPSLLSSALLVEVLYYLLLTEEDL